MQHNKRCKVDKMLLNIQIILQVLTCFPKLERRSSFDLDKYPEDFKREWNALVLDAANS